MDADEMPRGLPKSGTSAGPTLLSYAPKKVSAKRRLIVIGATMIALLVAASILHPKRTTIGQRWQIDGRRGELTGQLLNGGNGVLDTPQG